jgi:hypothetical protein
VRAGETIKLRVRFKDDLLENAQASGVYVHIFEPEEDEFDLGDAYLVSGVPTYLGEGIYEYQFTSPGDGPDGNWYDMWEGILTGQLLETTLQFEVSADGSITELPETQLWNNNVVQVTVTSGIKALDGSVLEEDYEFEFMTTANPAYTNIRKVMLKAGGFINNLEDDVIQTSILEASIEADVLTWAPDQVNLQVFRHARREYVTCLATSMLLNNLSSTSLKAKTLGDLHVEYDTRALQDAMQKVDECLERWQPQLMAGGGAKAATNPRYVVKGEYDPDRPIVSRMWESTEDGRVTRRIPAANTRERTTNNNRRHLRTYKKRYW